MDIKYTETAFEDIEYWKKRDKNIYKRIKLLINNIIESPFDGLGKPESLRYNLSGKWSRRITREHRIIYEVTDTSIIIHQCRYHYNIYN